MQIPALMNTYVALDSNTIQKVQLATPEPDDYEVLVQNEGCVFCNTTDKMIIKHLFATKNYPVAFGHESFGKVVRVGKKVKKYSIGDRVICANAIVNGFDGHYYSSWGGFSEYGIAGDLDAYLADGNILDEPNRYRRRYASNFIIPTTLSYAKACLAFPLAESASAIAQVGDLKGKTVVVIGTGAVGYLFTFFAKMFGAENVICLGRRESRLEIASKFGADKTFIDPKELTDYLQNGADIVFECSGNWRVLENGLPYLKNGGLFAIYAVAHQPYAMNLSAVPKCFQFQRIDPRVGDSLEMVCKLLQEDKIPIDLLLTHKWKFDMLPQAFEEVCNGNVIKGLVEIIPEQKLTATKIL